MAISTEIERINTEVGAQADLIAQIQTALAGKTGSGSGALETCTVHITSRDLDNYDSILIGYGVTQYMNGEIKVSYIFPSSETLDPVVIENVLCNSLCVVITSGFPDGLALSTDSDGDTELLGSTDGGVCFFRISSTSADVRIFVHDGD